MATFRELRKRLEPEPGSTMGTIILELVGFDDFKMTCLDCKYESATVSEYDEAGLEAISQWAQDHICVVWVLA